MMETERREATKVYAESLDLKQTMNRLLIHSLTHLVFQCDDVCHQITADFKNLLTQRLPVSVSV